MSDNTFITGKTADSSTSAKGKTRNRKHRRRDRGKAKKYFRFESPLPAKSCPACMTDMAFMETMRAKVNEIRFLGEVFIRVPVRPQVDVTSEMVAVHGAKLLSFADEVERFMATVDHLLMTGEYPDSDNPF